MRATSSSAGLSVTSIADINIGIHRLTPTSSRGKDHLDTGSLGSSS